MARKDAIGFFWEDRPVERVAKEAAAKRTPPERVWERPDYLPNLQEALDFKPDLFTDAELVIAQAKRERLVFDIESYPNYFLIAFKSLVSGKIIYFKKTSGEIIDDPFWLPKLHWILNSFTLISFNGINYDLTIASLAVNACTTEEMFQATEDIILRNERPRDVCKKFKVKLLQIDHIDLIEVSPLKASLKAYGGRLHSPRMQDLPFVPGTVLSPEQQAITLWYCCNDLTHTELLNNELRIQVELRESLSKEYGVDVRSRSDAQIAESVISKELEQLNGRRCGKPVIPIGTAYKYKVPHYLRYQSQLMQWVLNTVARADFIVDETGSIGMPPELKQLEIKIANSTYKLGIGGLHSQEQSVHYLADEEYILVDRDVASYYPAIILNQGLFPQHLGHNFLVVYRMLVDRRLAAKRGAAALKKEWKGKTIPVDVAKRIKDLEVTADTLKIVINGSFGKLGNKYSVIYSPDLLIQVTVTGQLSLLLLIERLELAGIQVVSANTDGVVIRCHKSKKDIMETIVKQWERDTGFETEDTYYKALYSRDVNNYIALKDDGTHKVKGAYSERGSNGNSILSKNPAGLICSDAAIEFLKNGTPIMTTLKNCKDVRRFVFVRSVQGGAVKDGEYLGKTIRWYYGQGETGEIVYAKNGNKVPRSDGAKPLMLLPDSLPEDVDYAWYESESIKILKEVSYLQD